MAEIPPGGVETRMVRGQYLLLHGRAQFALLAGSIIVLALTGLPQKFDTLGFSRWVMDVAGGIETLRLVHRLAGGVMFFSAVYHLALVLVAVLVVRAVGPLPMTPDLKDIRDAWQMVRYFLGLRQDRVIFERPSYFEKIDYLVIAWSVAVMGASGVVFLFPVRASRVLSGDAVLAALEVHSDGAILVVAWVVLVHLIYARLAPSLFPSRATILGVETARPRAADRPPPEPPLRPGAMVTGAGSGDLSPLGATQIEGEDHHPQGSVLPREPGAGV